MAIIKKKRSTQKERKRNIREISVVHGLTCGSRASDNTAFKCEESVKHYHPYTRRAYALPGCWLAAQQKQFSVQRER